MTVEHDVFLNLAWSQLWQVTVLALAVGASVRLLCHQRPHLAYLLWMLVVVKSLVPPIWSSPTGVFSWARPWAEVAVEESPPRPDPADRS